MTSDQAPKATSRRGWLSRVRALSSTLDQAMSSASNGLIVMAVARVTSVDAFGVASLLFATMAAALCVVRGAAGTPIMLAAGRGPADLRREAGFATTAVIVFAFIVSGAVALTAMLMGMPRLGLIFAVVIPLVLVVDVFRYSVISAAKPHLALLWDAVWALGSAAVFAVTVWDRAAFTEVGVLLSWTALAGVCLVGLTVSSRLRPRFAGIREWWQTGLGSRIRFGAEAGLEQITVIGILAMASAAAGASAAAALRGASVLVSPFAILISALPLVVIPQSVRDGESVHTVWRKLGRIGLILSAAVLAIGTGLCLLPEDVGRLILGDSWPLARSVLPIILVEYLGVTWMSTSMSFLRFQGKSHQLLITRIAFAGSSIVLCTAIAFATRSAIGVASGLAIVAVSTAIVLAAVVRPARSRTASGEEHLPSDPMVPVVEPDRSRIAD